MPSTLAGRRTGLTAALLSLFALLGSAGAPSATAAVTSPPALASPEAGATITDVVLRWSPLSGVTEYEVQVSPNGDWANNLSFSVLARGLQYSPPVSLDNASYFWRVRGSAGTVKGPWSEERVFNRAWTPVPQLLSPEDGDLAVATPTFSWTRISRASRYELHIGTDVNFSPGTYRACITDHTSYTAYTSVLPAQQKCDIATGIGVTYFWRVRGLDDPGNVLGRWSATRSFLHRKPLPEQTGPADGSSVEAPVLTWRAVEDSDQYVVTIYKRDGTKADSHETWATSYSPLTALKPADSPFSWTVRTKEYGGAAGLTPDRSRWWTFSVVAPSGAGAVPTPLSATPVDGSPRSPSLTWSPVTGAATYTVNYLSGGVFLPLQTRVPFAALTDPDKPTATGEFAWFVEAYSATGAYLGRGPESTFGIADQSAVRLIGPCPQGQVCANELDTPTLRWESAQHAGYYRVYVALDREFTNVVKEYVTQYTELTPRESWLDNQAGQSYYWFARACSGILCGPFGVEEHAAVATMRKQTSPVTGLQIELRGSASMLTWDDYPTARQYRVQVSASPDFAPLLDDIAVDQLTYAPFSKSYPGGRLLYARVSAVDGSNNLLTASSPLTFTLPAPPPTVTLSRDSITAGETVTVTYRGAPGSTVDVLARTSPATTYTRIARLTLGATGTAVSTHRPTKNTRIAARTATGTMSTAAPLVQVRSLASLTLTRVGVRKYTFSGRVLPAVNQRLVNVYRSGGLIAQARCDAGGAYRVTRVLSAGSGSFQARTASDTFNLGAVSPWRTLRIE